MYILGIITSGKMYCDRPCIVRIAVNVRRVLFTSAVAYSKRCKRWYSLSGDVRPSVCPSVTLRYCIKTSKASVMILVKKS